MRTLFGVLLFSVFSLNITLAFGMEKVEAPESCVHCGMDRTKFAHSRMIVEYDNGTSVGICSLNCAVIDMDINKGKKIKSILVADYNTKKLVDAEKAHWVIGGEKNGVMTMTPKWAFEKKEDADQFIKQFGGRLDTFDEAMKLAREDKRMKGMKKMSAATQNPGEKKCCSGHR